MTIDFSFFMLMILAFVAFLGFSSFGFASGCEGEDRAEIVAIRLALAVPVFFIVAAFLPGPVRWLVLGLAVMSALGCVLLFFLPIGRAEWGNDVPQVRIDERDIMFARARLEPGTPNYEAYYTLRPEHKAGDVKTRSLPGLLSPRASEANRLVYAATEWPCAPIPIPTACRTIWFAGLCGARVQPGAPSCGWMTCSTAPGPRRNRRPGGYLPN